MSTAPHRPSNEEVADQLEEAAELLHAHRAAEFRVRAYRDAARTLRRLEGSVIGMLERGGREALIALPAIGRSIASTIEEMAWRGRWSLLDRMRGEVSPVELFMTVPGIGETLAERIHRELSTDTLEELELAAHDGRLEQLSGIGPRRVHAIRDLLGAQLARSTRRRVRRVRERRRPSSAPPEPRPSIDLLLDLDRRYRALAEAGQLVTIAPKRFNERGERWLPIWHTDEGGWRFTLLYSNTERAHRLGKTGDWVVIYWERDGHEDQATVVTEYRGPATGERVIRGRGHERAVELGPWETLRTGRGH